MAPTLPAAAGAVKRPDAYAEAKAALCEQVAGVLEVGHVEALLNREKTDATISCACPRRPCARHRRPRLVAARSSHHRASCWRAIVRARWKQVSASVSLSGEHRSSSSPRKRCSSGSYIRSPFFSTSAKASSRMPSPSSALSRLPQVVARRPSCHVRVSVAPMARKPASPRGSGGWPRPAAPPVTAANPGGPARGSASRRSPSRWPAPSPPRSALAPRPVRVGSSGRSRT